MSYLNRLGGLRAAAIAVLLFACACGACARNGGRHNAPPSEITVAAAANLTEVFEEMAKRFYAQSGIRVVCSFGSTADLAKQIEHNAPFDLLAAADIAHVDELNRKGLIAAGTQAVYARGRLALWTPARSQAKVDRVEDLASPGVRLLAIAKPDLAPYGRAAVEALRALSIWEMVEPKVVYGNNVSQAKQYAATGNADAAIIPMSLVKEGEGRHVEIDERLYTPIDQAIAVIKASTKQEAARRFVAYVMSDEGQALLEEYGYKKIDSH